MKEKNTHISINPNTQQHYEIPCVKNDKTFIDSFIKKNHDKKVVVVQGLGFVGSVMSVVCANALNADYAVIGIDLPSPESYWKIKSINDGSFPLISSDPKVEKYFKNSIKKNNFIATYDPYAYSKADFIIVDINLDVNKQSNAAKDLINFSVDLTGFKSAITSIAQSCKHDALILIETTVPPGTTKLAKEIVELELEKRGLPVDQIKIGHSYERVMPGPNYIDSIQNFYRVYSGVNEYSENHVETFLKTIIRTDEYPLTKLNNTNATEIAKVLENSFRAMNIAFIVEWTRFAEEADVNLYEVINAIRMRPTHKNIMLPGIGVGGYCLTKDPLLASWAKQNLIGSSNELKMSEDAVEVNDKMPLYAFNFLQSFFQDDSLRDKRVSLFGVSYAPDVGDTRYTPVEVFYNELSKYTSHITLHDPYVSYWEEMALSVNTGDIVIDENVEIIIITTGHTIYKNILLNKLLNCKSIFLYDTIGLFDEVDIKKLNRIHKIKILGRGDI